MNCLKHTLGSYLELGDDLVLDEKSVANFSSKGCALIYFNKPKPGGKYRFRLFLFCYAETYACVRTRTHTRNMTDVADGIATSLSQYNADEDPEHEFQKLTTLVNDMCRKVFGTGPVTNMDNYYTSPEVGGALLGKRLYMHGTCRANRRGFPVGATFIRSEATKAARGETKVMVEPIKCMAAYGRVDGNPVHFLTTADGTTMTTVRRRIGSTIKTISVPIGIWRYNHGMQGTDCHDQLRQTFSLCSRHKFKKFL